MTCNFVWNPFQQIHQVYHYTTRHPRYSNVWQNNVGRLQRGDANRWCRLGEASKGPPVDCCLVLSIFFRTLGKGWGSWGLRSPFTRHQTWEQCDSTVDAKEFEGAVERTDIKLTTSKVGPPSFWCQHLKKFFFFLSRLRRLAFSWIFFVSSLKFWVFSLLKKVSIILPGRGAWLQWGGWTHLPHIQGPSGMHSVTCIGWQEEVGPPAPGWLLWCPGVVLWRISCNQDYDMKWFRVE